MGTSLYEPVSLADSAARTANGNGEAFRLPAASAVVYVLDLTDAKTDVGDTLDVSIQVRLDGTNWVDVVHFTQVLGNGSDDLTYVAKLCADVAEDDFEIGSALAAGSVRNLIGLETRAKWVIVDSGDADQTFTFSVIAVPM